MNPKRNFKLRYLFGQNYNTSLCNVIDTKSNLEEFRSG